MTTHHHVVTVLGKRHQTRKVAGAVLGVLGSALCALAMVANVTWAEEANWFMFVFAGFGVVGFGIMALGFWREWPKGREPAWSYWFAAIFWTTFAAYQVYGLIYQLFVTDADANWGLVAIVAIAAVAMFALAYREARKALAR